MRYDIDVLREATRLDDLEDVHLHLAVYHSYADRIKIIDELLSMGIITVYSVGKGITINDDKIDFLFDAALEREKRKR